MIRAQVKWWPGNVSVGGTHVHHLVWGILLLLGVGYVTIGFYPGSPVREILAVMFGIGMGLTLDEFALWLNLKDVYWSDKGRESIDAVIIVASIGAILLVGLRAWVDVADDVAGVVRVSVGVWVGLAVIVALLNALKGKLRWVIVSVVFWPAGMVGVLRRARAGSLWDRFSQSAV